MPKAGESHDIVMTIGGTSYGFMLAKGQDGAKLWSVYDSPTLLPQYTGTEPGYGNYPPEREIVKAQSDWRGGFGHQFYRNKPEYLSSSGADLRWKDHVIAGPLSVTTTIAAGATLLGTAVKLVEYNDSLYLATTTTVYKWNTGSSLWVAESFTPGGTITDMCAYSGLLYIAVGDSVNYWVTNGTTYFQSNSTVAKAKFFAVLDTRLFRAITPNIMNEMNLYGGQTIPYDITPPVVTAANSATAGAVTAGAHSYKVSFYYTPGGIDNSMVSGASNEITADGTHKVDITAIPLHPASGLGRNLWRTKSGGATYYLLTTIANNTTTTYADNTADGDLSVTEAPTMTQVNDWGTLVHVGDTETDITGLQAWRSLLYVGKEEGVYSVNTSATVTLVLADFRQYRSVKNCTKMCVWQDQLFFNVGKGGIYAYDGSNLDYLGWDLLAPDYGIYSEVGAFIPACDFLYVVVKPSATGGSGYLCSLRPENIDGTIDWRWHSIATIAVMDGPATGLVSSLWGNNPKLWIAGYDTNTSVNKPQYYALPQIGGVPSVDTGVSYTTTTTVITCDYDMGFRADLKLFTSVDILCKVPTSCAIAIGHSVDDASSYTAMGASIAAGVTNATRYVNVAGRRVKFQITLTASGTSTPTIYGIAVRGILRANRRKLYEFAVRISENIVLLSGGTEKVSQTSLANALKNADNPTVQAGVIALYDRDNASHNIVFEMMNEKELMDKAGKVAERIFFIRAIDAIVA